MKSFTLHLVPPAIALLVLVSFWNKKQSARQHLDDLRGRTERLAEVIANFKPTPVIAAVAAEPLENSAPKEPEEQVAPELPPIVVPGTLEELAETVAELIAGFQELDSQIGDEEPEPGTAEFRAQMEGMAEMMKAMTPIAAGFQILEEELQDPMLAGQLLANIVGQSLSLSAAKTARLGEVIGDLRTEVTQGGDPEILSEEFFNGLEHYVSPAEAAELRQTFHPRFLAMELTSAEAVFGALQ